MAKKREPPKLFWLIYRLVDEGTGVAVIESRDLLHARLKASLQLDPLSAKGIPANMIGRFLGDGDLRKSQRMLIKKSRLHHRCDGGRPPTAKRPHHDPP